MKQQLMIIRGKAHTALRKELERKGPALSVKERELLVDAADALLFDEPEAQDKRKQALELIDTLVEANRWTKEAADRAREALEGCGATMVEAELTAV